MFRESTFLRDQHKNMEAINATLRKIKYRGEQKLTHRRRHDTNLNSEHLNRFLTKLDIFSTTLGGDQYVTSSVLLPVIAAHCAVHKHKHPGRACVQLDGFPVEQDEAQPVLW